MIPLTGNCLQFFNVSGSRKGFVRSDNKKRWGADLRFGKEIYSFQPEKNLIYVFSKPFLQFYELTPLLALMPLCFTLESPNIRFDAAVLRDRVRVSYKVSGPTFIIFRSSTRHVLLIDRLWHNVKWREVYCKIFKA